MYDMQRETDGESFSLHRRGLAGWVRAARSVVLGAEARTFGWASGMDYVGRATIGRLHRRLQLGHSALLFVHLGGSARSARAAPALIAARRALHGAVFVSAIDAHAEPDIARQLSPSIDELPLGVHVTARDGARTFHPPFNTTELVGAAVASLPSLPTVCTSNQWRGLLHTSARGGKAAPESALAVVVGRGLRDTARIGCVGDARLLCAAVTHARCDLPSEVMSCPGVAMIWPSSSAHAGRMRRCVVEAVALPAALREHSAHVRHGRAVGKMALAIRAVVDTPPLRAASALGVAIGSGPLVAPVVRGAVQLLAHASAPLTFATAMSSAALPGLTDPP